FRDDSWRKVRPKELNYCQERNGVGEFAIAMLETGGHLEQSQRAGDVSDEPVGRISNLSVRQARTDWKSVPQARTPDRTDPWQVAWLGVAMVLGLLAVPPIRRSLFRRRAPRLGSHEPIRE